MEHPRRRRTRVALTRPGGPIFIGGEYRRLETRYGSGTFANNHINVSLGFEF
jgi:hypothetical protein